MKKRKPVANEGTRKKLKEAFEKIKQHGSTPFHKDDMENKEKKQKEEN